MLSKTHVVIGLSFGAGLLPALARQEMTGIEFGCVVTGLAIGSLLPDLDHPNGAINRRIPFFGQIVGRLFGHRGILHSILGVVLWLFLLSFIAATISAVFRFPVQFAVTVASGILIGYMLHIVADSFTKSGVRLFYPLKANIGLKLIRTGGTVELITRAILIGWCALQILAVVPKI